MPPKSRKKKNRGPADQTSATDTDQTPDLTATESNTETSFSSKKKKKKRRNEEEALSIGKEASSMEAPVNDPPDTQGVDTAPEGDEGVLLKDAKEPTETKESTVENEPAGSSENGGEQDTENVEGASNENTAEAETQVREQETGDKADETHIEVSGEASEGPIDQPTQQPDETSPHLNTEVTAESGTTDADAENPLSVTSVEEPQTQLQEPSTEEAAGPAAGTEETVAGGDAELGTQSVDPATEETGHKPEDVEVELPSNQGTEDTSAELGATEPQDVINDEDSHAIETLIEESGTKDNDSVTTAVELPSNIEDPVLTASQEPPETADTSDFLPPVTESAVARAAELAAEEATLIGVEEPNSGVDSGDVDSSNPLDSGPGEQSNIDLPSPPPTPALTSKTTKIVKGKKGGRNTAKGMKTKTPRNLRLDDPQGEEEDLLPGTMQSTMMTTAIGTPEPIPDMGRDLKSPASGSSDTFFDLMSQFAVFLSHTGGPQFFLELRAKEARLGDQLRQKVSEVERLQEEVEAVKSESDSKISALRTDLENEKADHEKNVEKLLEEKVEALARAQAEKEDEVLRVRDEFNTEVSRIEAENSSSRAQLQADCDEAVDTIQAEKNELSNTLENLKEELIQVQTAKEEALAKAETEKLELIASLEAQKEEALTALKNTMQEALESLTVEKDAELALAKSEMSELINKLQAEIDASAATHQAAIDAEKEFGKRMADQLTSRFEERYMEFNKKLSDYEDIKAQVPVLAGELDSSRKIVADNEGKIRDLTNELGLRAEDLQKERGVVETLGKKMSHLEEKCRVKDFQLREALHKVEKCRETLKVMKDNLGIIPLEEDKSKAKIQDIVDNIWNLVQRTFFKELAEPSIIPVQSSPLSRIPQIRSNTRAAQYMRCAFAEAVISYELRRYIFQDFYFLEDATRVEVSGLVRALKSLQQTNRLEATIIRCQLARAAASSIDTRQIPTAAADSVCSILERWLDDPETSNRFKSELTTIYQTALDLWINFQRSSRKIRAVNEVDGATWLEDEDRRTIYDENPNADTPNPGEESRHSPPPEFTMGALAVLFPQIISDEDILYPGLALFPSQASVVQAFREQRASWTQRLPRTQQRRASELCYGSRAGLFEGRNYRAASTASADRALAGAGAGQGQGAGGPARTPLGLVGSEISILASTESTIGRVDVSDSLLSLGFR